jgi:hypothetical protein
MLLGGSGGAIDMLLGGAGAGAIGGGSGGNMLGLLAIGWLRRH